MFIVMRLIRSEVYEVRTKDGRGLGGKSEFREPLVCFVPAVLATICARRSSAAYARTSMHKLVAGLLTLYTFSIVCHDASNARIG